MNVIFFTQSRTLDIFYELYLRLKDRLALEQVAFYVANLRHYESFLQGHAGFEDKFVVLKEWDIYREAAGHTANLERIRAYEEEIGDPTLWGPVVADRRLSMGKNASFRQDYNPRFSYDQILSLLDTALVKIDLLFRQVRPDLICTIYTATFGDCIGHLFAKARGIKGLDLRLARLRNYVVFVDGVAEPPPHIAAIFEEFSSGIPPDLKKSAEDYIESVAGGSGMYEGVVPGARGGKRFGDASGWLRRIAKRDLPRKCAVFFNDYRKSWKPPYCYDYQTPDVLRAYIYARFLNPLNVMVAQASLRGRLAGGHELKSADYILYPLHTEPELVLSQFARPYLNQIEVVRNISLSMPVGMRLFVKEHPMMVGRRSRGYYRKLVEIPNVELVDFGLSSAAVLERARLVVIIRGAIGLEAVVRRKPVVSLGQSMFDILPSCMFMRCRSLYDLPKAIGAMLTSYRYDHDCLVRYLAAVMKGSVPVNLVSDLLGKRGRFRSGAEWESESIAGHPHLDVLADYLVSRLCAGSLSVLPSGG